MEKVLDGDGHQSQSKIHIVFIIYISTINYNWIYGC